MCSPTHIGNESAISEANIILGVGLPLARPHMPEKTTLSRATTNSQSLRTTVPRGIVKHFDLAEGDSLEWRLEIRNAKLTIEVVPMKKAVEQPKTEPKQVRRRILMRKPASENQRE